MFTESSLTKQAGALGGRTIPTWPGGIIFIPSSELITSKTYHNRCIQDIEIAFDALGWGILRRYATLKHHFGMVCSRYSLPLLVLSVRHTRLVIVNYYWYYTDTIINEAL